MSKKLLGIIFGLISLSFVGLTTTTIINYNNLDENYYTQEDVYLKINELEEYITQKDSELQDALDTLKEEYKNKIEILQTKDEENAEAIKTLTDAYTAKVKELEASDKANADALAELKLSYETSLEELQAKDDVLDQLIADLDSELQTKIAEITLKYDGKVTEIENIIYSLKAVDTEQNEKIDTLITQVEALMNVPKYTISFDTDGAGSIDSQTIELGDKVLEPFAPSKDGYIFDGWFYGEEKWSFIGINLISIKELL